MDKNISTGMFLYGMWSRRASFMDLFSTDQQESPLSNSCQNVSPLLFRRPLVLAAAFLF